MSLDESLRAEFDTLVNKNKVVLFMKGTRRAPQCGFSATVVGILDELGPAYETVDVLSSPAVRDGIKEYSSWPTIPQLYIDGKFVGGCDIVREMHASGDLGKALGVQTVEATPPKITLTSAAAKAFREAREGESDALRFEIDARFQYGLFFGPKQAGDLEVESAGIPMLIDRASARRAEGVTIDFVEGPNGAGFKIDNPNEPARVKQISVADLKGMMDRKERFELFDVRTDREREIAKIPGARQLDEAARREIEAMDRSTPLVFHCHHGGRSQQAAEAFLGRGFKDVSNVRGGIDAWSASVDPAVARY
jgi:monothiol glutaredoxin